MLINHWLTRMGFFFSESETQDLDIPQKSPIDRQRESSEHGKSSEELVNSLKRH